jgi:hypothetical protein
LPNREWLSNIPQEAFGGWRSRIQLAAEAGDEFVRLSEAAGDRDGDSVKVMDLQCRFLDRNRSVVDLTFAK